MQIGLEKKCLISDPMVFYPFNTKHTCFNTFSGLVVFEPFNWFFDTYFSCSEVKKIVPRAFVSKSWRQNTSYMAVFVNYV